MISRLARHTIALSIKYDKTITASSLNRILFFTIGITISQGTEEQVKFIKDRYNNEFEKKGFGAVPAHVYYRYNYNGYRRITRGGKYYEDLEFFNRILFKLMDADPETMVAININMSSHKMWDRRIKEGLDVPPWTFEEIRYEFSQLKGRI